MGLTDGRPSCRAFENDAGAKKKSSGRQEKRLAKLLGGRKQPMSGALPGMKGDVKTSLMTVEAKQTAKKSIRITLEMLKKIEDESIGSASVPAIAIELLGRPAGYQQDWIMLPAHNLAELINAAEMARVLVEKDEKKL